MTELKEDLLTINKILSKYIFEFDNNIGKINPKYIKDKKMRFPVSMAHRNIEFALHFLIDDNERHGILSEIKLMRAKDENGNIEIVNPGDEEL